MDAGMARSMHGSEVQPMNALELLHRPPRADARSGTRRRALRRALPTTVMTFVLAAGSLLAAATPAFGKTPAADASTPAGAAPTTASTTSLSSYGEPFHFLPPLGVEAGNAANFDASLLDGLIVTICRVEGSACTPVKTLTSTSTLSERLRIGQTSGEDSYYLANWDVSKLRLEPYSFRVTVTIARLQVGSIDVGPSTYKSFGRTWPIKFRIENNPVIRVRVLHEAGKGASQIG
ncbi:MAG TPA: hypothetical protein VFI15_07620, partial [Candidatus Limnocylindrales bacterium]|nr:hypothetical protein [Candidatus Limnocylindrales bacterium]